LIGRGLSNKDVARELGLSPGTVKIHVHNIFVKLGEKSRHRVIVEHDKWARAVGPAAAYAPGTAATPAHEGKTGRQTPIAAG
jgi:Bacterial regulatory proteins, luxR family